MDGTTSASGCTVCGPRPADTLWSGEGPLCDACVDERVSARTGLPRLPEAPEPVTIVAADGRPCLMRYRLWRAPTGISVRLVEDGAEPEAGFEFAEFGDHDADVAELIDVVTGRAEVEMRHAYLVPDPSGRGWQLDDDEVVGRVGSFDSDDGMPSLVVDGRVLTWGSWVLPCARTSARSSPSG